MESEKKIPLEKGQDPVYIDTKKILIIFAGAFQKIPILKAQEQFVEFFGRITNFIGINPLDNRGDVRCYEEFNLFPDCYYGKNI